MAGWTTGFVLTTVTYTILCYVLYGLLLLIMSDAAANLKLWDCWGEWAVHREVALTGATPARR